MKNNHLNYIRKWAILIFITNIWIYPINKGWSQVLPDSVSYENLNDLDFCAKIPLSFAIKSYSTQDGSVLKEGDRLIIGRPSTNNPNFTYWFLGSGLTTGPMPNTYQAENVIIDKITVFTYKMLKKSPRHILIKVKSPTELKLANNRTLDDYEKALILGEVINPNAALSKEEAIKKLKESKDLLDIGIINQAKFDSIKSKLSPIILKQ